MRHGLLVRVTHWVMTLAFFALLVSGLEIVLSHPRFYWGEVGNVNTAPLFKIPLPSSRDTVPTGYGYVLPDQNGWSRYLHFQSAWVFVLTGVLYVGAGLLAGHFRRNLVPAPAEVAPKRLAGKIWESVRLRRPGAEEAWSYNAVQRMTYLVVIFVLAPLVVWTGLAMSPAFVSAVPSAVNVLGGQQSARTLHFVVTLVLMAFLLAHVSMVALAGFWSRMRAMITGRAAEPVERV